VVARNVDPGALAAPGQPLLRIEDASKLRIRVTASNNMARNIKPGTTLDARIGGEMASAVVEGIVPSATGNLVVIHALVANPHDSLRSSSVATLLLKGAAQEVRLIPETALFQEGSLTGVRVRGEQGDDIRWIRTGKSYGSLVEVLSGLRIGETILVPSDKGGK
jgi:multidrug efflux pump subunit AcrA (membrane-fusion protein)